LIKIRFNKNNYTVKMSSKSCDIESDLIIVPETPEIQKENEIIETPEKEDTIIEETPEQTNDRKQETSKRKTFELLNQCLQGDLLTPDEQRKVYKIFKGRSCTSGRKFCKGRHPPAPQQKAPTNFSVQQPREQPAVSQQNPFDFPLGGQPAVRPFGFRQTEIPNSNPSDVWRQFGESKRDKRIEHSKLVTVAERFCIGFLHFFSEEKLNESEYAQQKRLFDKMLKFCIRQKRHRDIIQEARKYCIDYLEDFYPDTTITESERNKEKRASDLFLDMMDLCEKYVI
jgi:hypothetical protein